MNLSFSGCGFLGIYHIGVIEAFRDNAPSMLQEFKCLAGASAGAIAALVTVSGCPTSRIRESYISTAEKARAGWTGPFSSEFDLKSILHRLMDDTLPANIHRDCSGRLHVSLTAVSSLKNRIVSHFNTRLELMKVLNASCYIPVWGGLQRHSYRGQLYMDGGISNNLPTDFQGETVTVSPFSGKADICPVEENGWNMSFNLQGTNIRLTWSNAFRLKSALFPPNNATLQRIFDCGYRDCVRFLQKRGLCPQSLVPNPTLQCPIIMVAAQCRDAIEEVKQEEEPSVVSFHPDETGVTIAIRLTAGQLLLLPHRCTDMLYAFAILLAVKAKHIILPNFEGLSISIPEMSEPVEYTGTQGMIDWKAPSDSGVCSPVSWEIVSPHLEQEDNLIRSIEWRSDLDA